MKLKLLTAAAIGVLTCAVYAGDAPKTSEPSDAERLNQLKQRMSEAAAVSPEASSPKIPKGKKGNLLPPSLEAESGYFKNLIRQLKDRNAMLVSEKVTLHNKYAAALNDLKKAMSDNVALQQDCQKLDTNLREMKDVNLELSSMLDELITKEKKRRQQSVITANAAEEIFQKLAQLETQITELKQSTPKDTQVAQTAINPGDSHGQESH